MKNGLACALQFTFRTNSLTSKYYQMTTLNEILNAGFRELNNKPAAFDEYECGMVRVHVSAGMVINVFVTDIKVKGVEDIDKLLYVCKRINQYVQA